MLDTCLSKERIEALADEGWRTIPSEAFGKIMPNRFMGAAYFAVTGDEAFLGSGRDYELVKEGIKDLLPRDVDNLILQAKEFEARASYYRERMKELKGMAEHNEAQARALREMLGEAIAARGPGARAEGLMYRAGVAVSQRVVGPEEQEELAAIGEAHPDLVCGKLSLVKDEVKKALRAGVAVPGCRLENVRHVRVALARADMEEEDNG